MEYGIVDWSKSIDHNMNPVNPGMHLLLYDPSCITIQLVKKEKIPSASSIGYNLSCANSKI